MALSQVPRELMSQVPAGANPVDAIAAPGGGYWVLGADGGVFAVGGAPFHGAYVGQSYADDPNRIFTRILSGGQNGYTLLSAKNELYEYLGTPTPEPEKVDVPTVEQAKAEPSQSATVWLQDQLSKVGLGELAPWALGRFNELGGTAGAAEGVMVEMRDQPAYKAKFPGMEARQKAGKSPMTEGQYLEWQDKYKRIMMNAGLPERFYDQDSDFTDFISKDVSPVEIEKRVQDGYRAAMQAPAEVRNELERLYGIGTEQLAAFFLDPKRAEEEWTNALARGELSGAATMKGFGGLSIDEAARLQSQGLGFGEASTAFAALGQQTELFEDSEETDSAFTREDKLKAAGEIKTGGAATSELERRAKQKKARFEGGGSYAEERGGITGLGTSNS